MSKTKKRFVAAAEEYDSMSRDLDFLVNSGDIDASVATIKRTSVVNELENYEIIAPDENSETDYEEKLANLVERRSNQELLSGDLNTDLQTDINSVTIIKTAIDETLDQKGLSDPGVKLATVVIESICNRNNLKLSTKPILSLESFGGKMSKKEASRITSGNLVTIIKELKKAKK